MVHTFTLGDMGSILGWRTKDPTCYMAQPKKKIIVQRTKWQLLLILWLITFIIISIKKMCHLLLCLNIKICSMNIKIISRRK